MNCKLVILVCSIGMQAHAANSSLKNLFSLIVGTTLALAGHQVLEGVTTLTHEMGHAVANKLMTGDPISVRLIKTKGPVGLLVPWGGVTHAKGSLAEEPVKEAFMLAGGPIAGISAACLQLYALGRLQKARTGDDSYSTTPAGFFKDVYEGSYNVARLIKNEKRLPDVSTLGVALAVSKFLRCSRIVGESAYGFLPFGVSVVDAIQGAQGDGHKLWRLLLKKPDLPPFSNKLVECTVFAMLTPCIAGIGKAYKN